MTSLPHSWVRHFGTCLLLKPQKITRYGSGESLVYCVHTMRSSIICCTRLCRIGTLRQKICYNNDDLYFTTVFVCALSELNHNAQHFVRHRALRVVGNCEGNLIVLITSDHSFKVITVGVT